MKDYILLMHSDAPDTERAENAELWERYLGLLHASGSFDGGSAVGAGARFRKGRDACAVDSGISGYLRVRARDLEDASSFLSGNPVFEAGGTVEVRELPPD